MVINILDKWDNFCTQFKTRWSKHKENNTTAAAVESGFVGATSSTMSALCIRSAACRLADKENTYGGAGPIMTGVAGILFGIFGITSCVECGKTLKEMKAKSDAEAAKIKGSK